MTNTGKKASIQVGNMYGYWQVQELYPGRKIKCLCTVCNTSQLVDYLLLVDGKSESCCQGQAKRKATCIERYGTEHPQQSLVVQEKTRNTNIQRYGVVSTTLVPEVRAKQIKTTIARYGVDSYLKLPEQHERARQTCLIKYGVAYPLQSSIVFAQMQATNVAKYGVTNVFASPVIKNKIAQTNLQLYGATHPMRNKDVQIKSQTTHMFRYGATHFVQLPQNRNKLKEWCEANPGSNGQSKSELEVLTWVQTFYPSATKLKQDGNELDIFIPELNLGIEYNGLFWHSEINKSNTYHLDKTKYFASKGIRTIHIWEYEWLTRQDQVKSFLLSALNKNTIRLGARKCKLIWSDDLKEIAKAHSLLDFTHIQGHTNSTKYVANAYYNDELVATATFGKHHRDSTTWVLSRFTTKTNYTIQGILSKITKLASRELQSDIISWADYRLSHSNGYEKAGWTKEKLLAPDYFYFKGSKIISKQSRQKKKVKTPEGMTEAEHAKLDGLTRVYDCGKIRYRFKSV